MSFSNSSHKGRLALISSVKDVSAILRSYPFAGAKPVRLEGSDLSVMYQAQEVETSLGDTTFHVPFLFHKSGIPWHEANDYLLQSIKNKTHKNLRNDDLRRIAGRLLDYLMFCEERNLDWLDFTGSRPVFRPTYKYFDYLVNQSGRSNAVINQYTAAIYELYKYVSSSWHVIDIDRVDTVRDISFFVKYGGGGVVVSRKKRGQTLSVPPKGRVPLGFVLEDGEFLRPLANSELSCLLKLLSSEKEWPMQERLILLMSLMTGARKQTILTMRLRHLEAFNPSKLLLEGAYKLHAGPGTGMDTKKGVPQILYVPKQLAEELLVFSKSPLMTARRAKLRSNIESSGYPWVEEDAYLFISDQGNCCYMGKDDPRYREVKSRQTGQVTDNMRRKLISSQEAEFPKDFSFHWLRATYAYQLYQRLQKLIGNGMLKPGEDIQFIQKRMHHRSRKNHLSHSSMKALVAKLAENESTQLFIATHSSHICSRLDLRHALLIGPNAAAGSLKFSKLVEYAESGGSLPADSVVPEALSRFDAEHVRIAWSKALERRAVDPEGAITMARTLLESTCKLILDEAGESDHETTPDLNRLYKQTATLLNLTKAQHEEVVFKQILGGCTAVVEGLGSLRNKLSDAHGKGKAGAKAAPRHAELAVNLAGSTALFLLATWEAKTV